MKTYHLRSLPDWGLTIEQAFRRLGRQLDQWRAKLPAWKRNSY